MCLNMLAWYLHRKLSAISAPYATFPTQITRPHWQLCQFSKWAKVLQIKCQATHNKISDTAHQTKHVSNVSMGATSKSNNYIKMCMYECAARCVCVCVRVNEEKCNSWQTQCGDKHTVISIHNVFANIQCMGMCVLHAKFCDKPVIAQAHVTSKWKNKIYCGRNCRTALALTWRKTYVTSFLFRFAFWFTVWTFFSHTPGSLRCPPLVRHRTRSVVGQIGDFCYVNLITNCQLTANKQQKKQQQLQL